MGRRRVVKFAVTVAAAVAVVVLGWEKSRVGTEAFVSSPVGRRGSAAAGARRRHLEVSKAAESLGGGGFLEDFQEGWKRAGADLGSVRIGSSPFGGGRGLVAAKAIRQGQTVASVPTELCLSGATAAGELKERVKGVEGWTGDIGIIALQILQAKSEGPSSSLHSWVSLLPEAGSPGMDLPLFWPDDEIRLADRSSTRGFSGLAADIADDFELYSRRLSSCAVIGPSVLTLENFKWAVGCALSRGVVLDDGSLVLAPFLDFANHSPSSSCEPQSVRGGGIFGGSDSIRLVADRDFEAGEEFCINYGSKPAAAYLEEHGFVPSGLPEVAEVQFEVRGEDRFVDDKLDILGEAGVEPRQSFLLEASGDLDESMLQFLRLVHLGAGDAFLLEAIFRNDIWNFLELPLSEENEFEVNAGLIQACKEGLDDFEGSSEEEDLATLQDAKGRKALCVAVRLGESRALTNVLALCKADNDALERKEYYQERRLKELGLDRPLRDDEIVTPGGAARGPESQSARGFDW